MREIVLDTETTGLDPNYGHKIIEIGCIELMDHISTGNIYHAYINPMRAVPQEAFRIHAISTQFLVDKPKFAAVADDFLNFIGDSTLIIHNAKFDMKFLNYELEEIGYAKITNEVIDTLMLARQKFPGAQASLDALCKRFEIDNSKREKHGAVIDCQLLAEVYINLLGGRQTELSLSKNIEEIEKKIVNLEQYQKRNFAVDGEEIEAHEKMIDEISNAMWRKVDGK